MLPCPTAVRRDTTRNDATRWTHWIFLVGPTYKASFGSLEKNQLTATAWTDSRTNSDSSIIFAPLSCIIHYYIMRRGTSSSPSARGCCMQHAMNAAQLYIVNEYMQCTTVLLSISTTAFCTPRHQHPRPSLCVP